jgi:hypothetical protein
MLGASSLKLKPQSCSCDNTIARGACLRRETSSLKRLNAFIADQPPVPQIAIPGEDGLPKPEEKGPVCSVTARGLWRWRHRISG